MSARDTRITPEYARLLVRLAREATRLSGPKQKKSALREFAKQLKTHADFRHVATRSIHYLRLLRHALGVFGNDLWKHLRKYGVAKVCRIAKLSSAKTIMKSGKIKLTDETAIELDRLTKRKLDLILLAAPLKSGERQARTPAPGDVFSIPRDVIAVRELLLEKLKSLRPRHEGVPPRYAVKALKNADPPTTKALRRELEQLRDVINVYRLLVDELLEADLEAAQVKPLQVKVGDTRRARPELGRRVENVELLRALRRLPHRA